MPCHARIMVMTLIYWTSKETPTGYSPNGSIDLDTLIFLVLFRQAVNENVYKDRFVVLQKFPCY